MTDQETNLSLPESDPHFRRDLIYPQLTQEMVARTLSYGTIERFAAGSTISARGDRDVSFLLVLSGSVAITAPDDNGEESVVTIHGERQFSGELNLFSHRETLVTARAVTAIRVLRIPFSRFREFVASEPDIGDLIMRAAILRRTFLVQHSQGGVALVGSPHAADTLRIQNFLSRNEYPHWLIETDNDGEGSDLIAIYNLDPASLPVVISGDVVLRNPTNIQVAESLGIEDTLDATTVYDVAVIGAGPAGLSTAVYASSEGLRTLVIEGSGPGGQAGTSSRIENYLGFPMGISGLELASRAQAQAQKFGAKMALSRNVISMDCSVRPFRLCVEGTGQVLARSVVIASGARYRRLDVADYVRFEMSGIHYSATAIEARLCTDQEVIVVGGGNSAGQAAVFLAGYAKHVHILIRGSALAKTMSEYLVSRIHSSRHITLHADSEITALQGGGKLTGVQWRNSASGDVSEQSATNIFVMIGADPSTQWLGTSVRLDPKGFVETGPMHENWERTTYETSIPGVFAVGDVRAGSVKRVASSVGEGSVVVSAVHAYLKKA